MGANLHVLEIIVERLIALPKGATRIVTGATEPGGDSIWICRDVLGMTSRKLIVGHEAPSNLNIGGAAAVAPVQIEQNISVRPRYLTARVWRSSCTCI
jgi:hypothetical protein